MAYRKRNFLSDGVHQTLSPPTIVPNLQRISHVLTCYLAFLDNLQAVHMHIDKVAPVELRGDLSVADGAFLPKL